MKLKDIADMEDYLENRCYCPYVTKRLLKKVGVTPLRKLSSVRTVEKESLSQRKVRNKDNLLFVNAEENGVEI